MKKKWLSVFLFGLIAVCGKAQTEGYYYHAKIDSVKTSGFYQIDLGPALNAHIKTDFSDIRIVNDAGKWIPHVLDGSVGPFGYIGTPVNIPVEFETTTSSPATTEMILKGNDAFIAAFDINVKNTSATRVAKLSGSDNKQNWFVIVDSLLLLPEIAEKPGETRFHIDFPACNYKYYKLVIDNKANDPVNFMGITTPIYVKGGERMFLAENPKTAVFQKDSGKISYIRVSQEADYHVNQLGMKVLGAKYYYRRLEVYLPADNSHSFSTLGTLLQSFYFSNNSSLDFVLPRVNPKVFYLLIYNEDNPPLKVEAVSTKSNTRSLTAYLEKGVRYELIMDNPSAIMPDYDLSKLNNIIPDSVQLLNTENIIPFERKETILSKEKNNKWILWVAIAIAIIILLFFTQRMLKEVDKRKSA